MYIRAYFARNRCQFTMVTATFYSNNVFYGAVDVLRFWRCGIVPSGVGRGGWVGAVGIF